MTSPPALCLCAARSATRVSRTLPAAPGPGLTAGVAGIVGLILGIVAAVRGAFSPTAITAIVVAGAAPIISFIVFSLIPEAP